MIVLGGPWVDIGGVISPLICVIANTVTLHITPLITTMNLQLRFRHCATAGWLLFSGCLDLCSPKSR